MKNIGVVKGSGEQAKELIVGFDTVYVHKNIKKLEDGDYQYEEVQYDKDEYIELIAKKNEFLVEKNKTLEKQVTDTQLALTELYEMKGE
jgi:hypothetical protein|nr:MAG TPA: hypothetical protein [Caudoviricetes sp.]